MSLPRFYCPIPLSADSRVDLPEAAARHACRVLRLREGDELVLFDGTGGEYAVSISTVGRDRVAVDVHEWRDVDCEAPIKVTLVQALQSGEKMDLTVQKAVELGVSRIVPVTSRRSVAISACEQCGRNRVPDVSALEGLERWLGKADDKDVLRLMFAPGSAQTLDSIEPPAPGGRVELLIGAEGGLAPEEVERAAQAGFVSIRLGPRILRTETAGLAALAAIQCLWGDFRKGADHV